MTPADSNLEQHSLLPVVTTRAELEKSVADARAAGKRIGLVPTMGALHAGHLSLVDAARAECDFVVVTIFVNPTQFAPHEDFAAYPRDLQRDRALLAAHAADLIYAPTTAEIYRPEHETRIEVGSVAQGWEGTSRPTHFAGVATVVLKLFNQVQADVAFFGQKDYQQMLVIRQMVADLDVPITVRICPIVREPDGLAMSSRNAYLSAEERQQALVLSQSLQRAAELYATGERSAEAIRQAMLAVLSTVPAVQLEYIALVADGTVTPVERLDQPTVIALAARVGKTRLIDNRLVGAAERA